MNFLSRAPAFTSMLDGDDPSAMFYIKGVVYKRRQSTAKFQRRWFSLNFGDLILRYYDVGNYSTVRGSIDMRLAHGFSAIPDNSANFFRFVLQLPAREYVLAVATANERDAWLRAFAIAKQQCKFSKADLQILAEFARAGG